MAIEGLKGAMLKSPEQLQKSWTKWVTHMLNLESGAESS